ncbi:hypothetical protein D3C87_2195350 [compost metagenome]
MGVTAMSAYVFVLLAVAILPETNGRDLTTTDGKVDATPVAPSGQPNEANP